MISAVFFDFGGVIALPKWTLEDYYIATKSALTKHGIIVPNIFREIFLKEFIKLHKKVLSNI